MTRSDRAAAMVAFALDELAHEGVERPSRGAVLDVCRSVTAVSKGVDAGLHVLPGVVVVDVLDGEDNGFARGEAYLDVRGDDLDPDVVRAHVHRWIGDQARRVVVRVRDATLVDVLIARWRWASWRRLVASELARVPR